ncbi:hypothetical protein GCM10027612_78770 [Microbispora bryophytorum subsp. camponoti]
MRKVIVTAANEAQRAAWLGGGLPEVERVRPGLWSIPVPIPINPLRYVLVYALEVPDGVVIIDAGWNTEEAYDALVAGLATAGYEITDVQAVLVTHIHPDHYGLAGRVREVSGAWIGLHPADARNLHDRYDESAIESLVRRERALLVRCGVPDLTAQELAGASVMLRQFVAMATPDRLIEDGDRLDLPGWDLRAIWTPATRPVTCASWSRSAACCSPETTCSPGSRRWSPCTPSRRPTRSPTTSTRCGWWASSTSRRCCPPTSTASWS